MGTKRSKIFIEEVDKDILEKLLDGWTPFQIVEYLMENWVKLEGLLKDRIEIKSENVTTLNMDNVTDQKLEELLNKIINK